MEDRRNGTDRATERNGPFYAVFRKLCRRATQMERIVFRKMLTCTVMLSYSYCYEVSRILNFYIIYLRAGIHSTNSRGYPKSGRSVFLRSILNYNVSLHIFHHNTHASNTRVLIIQRVSDGLGISASQISSWSSGYCPFHCFEGKDRNALTETFKAALFPHHIPVSKNIVIYSATNLLRSR